MSVKVLLLGAPFALLMLALCFRYWRATILAIPFWLLLEGVFRKWVFPSAHIPIYFIKDIVLMAAFLRFLSLRMTGRMTRHSSLKVYDFFFLLLVVWTFLEMFNPSIPHVAIAIMGIKVHLFYLFFLYASPYLFDSKEELLRYLRWYVVCSLPLLILGIVQFFSPPGSFITTSLSWGDSAAEYTSFGGSGLFGDRVRITSTFAYLTEYAGYLTVLTMLLISMMQIKQLKGRWILYPLAALAGVNLMMTGSRAPILFIAVGTTLFFFMSGIFSVKRFIGIAFRLGWVAIVASLVIAIQFPEAFQAFRDRASTTNDGVLRLFVPILEPWDKAPNAGPFGYGVGTAHQSTRFLVGSDFDWGPMDRAFEGEQGRVMMELGIMGFILFYVFRIILLIYMWGAVNRCKDLDLKMLAIALFILNVIFAVNGVLFSNLQLVSFWFFAGVVLRVPDLTLNSDSEKQTVPEDPRADFRLT